MERIHRYLFIFLTALVLIIFSQCFSPRQLDEYYCNLMAGEPTQTSVILVARLHKSDTLVNNDLQGIEGFIKFRITRDVQSGNYMESPFYRASENNDFAAKYEFTGLRPGQKYFYSISYGKDTSNNTSSSWNSFKTLNLPVSDKNISFAVTNAMNYQNFQADPSKINSGNRNSISYHTRFPVFSAITWCNPDFWIVNGETEFTNYPDNYAEDSQNEIRMQWHNLFCIPELNNLYSNIPSFWMQSENPLIENSIIDQLPVYKGKPDHKTYRTYRLNRDVQIWMLSKLFSNQVTAGNSEQARQLNWLKASLKESDSPFKLLISAAPFIGTDDFNLSESPSDSESFRRQKDSLFIWLKGNGFLHNGLYFICNMPDLQYHSINPMGFEEFSCGTFVNSGIQIKKGVNDSISVDLREKIIQPYFQTEASNGFLMVYSGRNEYNSPVLVFRFFDERRKLLYSVNKY